VDVIAVIKASLVVPSFPITSTTTESSLGITPYHFWSLLSGRLPTLPWPSTASSLQLIATSSSRRSRSSQCLIAIVPSDAADDDLNDGLTNTWRAVECSANGYALADAIDDDDDVEHDGFTITTWAVAIVSALANDWCWTGEEAELSR
jgi:hypothetical protein